MAEPIESLRETTASMFRVNLEREAFSVSICLPRIRFRKSQPHRTQKNKMVQSANTI